MSKPTKFDRPMLYETSIVEGSNDVQALLVARCNNTNVGVPVVSAANSDYLSLLGATPTFDLHDSTLYTLDTDGVSVYKFGNEPLGIAFEVLGTRVAVPLYTLPQNPDDVATVTFNDPTLVAEMDVWSPSAKPKFMFPRDGEEPEPEPDPIPDGPEVKQNSLLITIDKINFGIPLFTYEKVLDPLTRELKDKWPDDMSAASGIAPSALDIVFAPYSPTTVVGTGKPTIDIEGNHGSTFVNSKIKAYSDLIDRVKRAFGWPVVEIDMCDENIAEFIDQAIEVYTKYAGYTEEFLVFDSAWYKPGVGIPMDRLFAMTPEMRRRNLEKAEQDWDYDLNNYRKILDVFSVTPGEQCGANSLFTFEYTLAQQTYFGFLGGQMSGFDLVTWNCVKNWLDCREKVLGLIPSFRFEPQTQYLRIYPEPLAYSRYFGMVSCYVTKTLKELLVEPFIYEYACALTAIAVGRIRSKYTFQLLGGAQIQGENLLQMGLDKKKELDEMLWKGTGWVDTSPMVFMM